MAKTRFTETYTGTTLRKLAEGVERVDREAGVLRGVKLLGYESKNDEGRRRYVKPQASLYENRPVNVNHPGWEDVKVQDRWGVIMPGTVAVEDDGVFGDIEFNPHKPSTEEILWWAEKHPDQLGMSHVAFGESEVINDMIWLTVTEVESVDLVARPATTEGFFEAKEQESQMNYEDLYKESQRKLEAETARADTAEKALTVAEQSLATEQADRAKSESDAKRRTMLTEADLGKVKPAFAKAVLACESDEDAAALIDSVKTSVTEAAETDAQPRSEGAPAGESDTPKDLKEIRESGGLDYKTRK